ncbi:hypothetical protein [Streptomyces sp. NRRL WC-3618]|nr:hypothetical protein [Streptomyces sp. NRRL WC-3618]
MSEPAGQELRPLGRGGLKTLHEVLQDGVYTVKEIHTPKYAADCAEIGLK